MMRAASYLSLLLALLLFGVVCHFSVQTGLDKVEKSVTEVLSALEKSDWKGADRAAEEALKHWNRRRAFYSLITRHDLFNVVSVAMQSLSKSLAGRDKSSAETLTVALREQLVLMKTTEDFRWENVF